MITRDEICAARIDAIDRGRVVQLRVPRGVNIAVRSNRRCWVTVHAKHGVAHTGDVGHGCDREWFAPGSAAVARFDHVCRIKRREAGRTVPENVQCAIGSHDWAGALSIEHVARDALRRAERCALIRRVGEEDRRLDVASIVGVKEEPRPGDIDAILERASRMPVHSDPLLVVEGRGRSRLVDKRWRTPRVYHAAIECAFADRDGVGRRSAIKAQAGVENVSLAIERQRGITARIVLAADEALDPRNEGSDLAWVSCRCVVSVWVAVAAPSLPAIVRVVRARVTVTEGAARVSINATGPG